MAAKAVPNKCYSSDDSSEDSFTSEVKKMEDENWTKWRLSQSDIEWRDENECNDLDVSDECSTRLASVREYISLVMSPLVYILIPFLIYKIYTNFAYN